MAVQFEVGKSYSARSTCDHDCVFAYTVIARTAKQITLRDEDGNETCRGVYLYENEEHCLPLGRYSMAPVLCARRADKARVLG